MKHHWTIGVIKPDNSLVGEALPLPKSGKITIPCLATFDGARVALFRDRQQIIWWRTQPDKVCYGDRVECDASYIIKQLDAFIGDDLDT